MFYFWRSIHIHSYSTTFLFIIIHSVWIVFVKIHFKRGQTRPGYINHLGFWKLDYHVVKIPGLWQLINRIFEKVDAWIRFLLSFCLLECILFNVGLNTLSLTQNLTSRSLITSLCSDDTPQCWSREPFYCHPAGTLKFIVGQSSSAWWDSLGSSAHSLTIL